MAPETKTDQEANEWFNGLIQKLRYGQDYQIYPGSSKKMFDDEGREEGICIIQGDVRLYSTGITKLYEMVVEGKEYEVQEYTEAEKKEFEEAMKKKWPEVFSND